MPNRKKGHLHPGCRRRGGKASPQLWLPCRSHRTVSSRTLAKLELSGLGHRARGDQAQEELGWGQRGASPRRSAQFAVSGDARGVVLCPWGWWGCELGPGHTGTMCAMPAAGTGKDRLPHSLPLFPVALGSLAQQSCSRCHSPSPCPEHMHRSPLLCPRCPLLAHSSQLPPGTQFTSHREGSSHPSPFRPGPSGHLPATPLGP